MQVRGAVKQIHEFFDIDGLAHREFVPPVQSLDIACCAGTPRLEKKNPVIT
jgi:hypothetical protein